LHFLEGFQEQEFRMMITGMPLVGHVQSLSALLEKCGQAQQDCNNADAGILVNYCK
jgi:hypothetical protein